MIGAFGQSAPPTHDRRLRRLARKAVRRFLLSAGAILVVLSGFEGVLGLLPRTGQRVLSRSGRLGSVAVDCYPTNPRGYFDLYLRDPAARSRFDRLGVRRVRDCASQAPYAVEYRYNSLEFRDREPGSRRRGVRRVIVLGDSFTEGQGVKESDVYPRVLETTLNGAANTRWEVFNFGRRGADFPVLHENFEKLLAFDPDVVIYAMVLNDGEQSPRFRTRDPLLSEWLTGRGRHGLSASSRPFGRRTALFVRNRIERLRIDRGTSGWYDALYGSPNHEGWMRTQARLREMHRRMRERGGQFLVVVWPMLVELDGRYPFVNAHTTIARFCREAGIPYFDLLQALQGTKAAVLWVHPLDPHPNEIAHRMAAKELAPLVTNLLEGGET
jgi:lysophospholipase L1-like esterase